MESIFALAYEVCSYQSLELSGSCQIPLKKPMRAGVCGELGNPSKRCMVPVTIFWNERNRRCFDEISIPNNILKSNSLVFLYGWFSQAPVITVDLFLEDYVCFLVI
ncbi:hypothetical protein MTR67_010455 [Solanum verrucosum]|uniref:Uncharacterized protein n=1 Tax=Solanum verrucosum TaxID=315347 RepID=A0AAF0Q993_SOLVR|nr:hypothetical protein MTR67_010455 [Solanum verrucosum]